MKNSSNSTRTIKVSQHLHQLLLRCSHIEERTVEEIIVSLLSPYLKKYSYNSLEQWEEAQETEELINVRDNLEINENFDPNHIPFNSQILGLRRKMDDIEREMKSSKEPRPDLEELLFSIIEKLNFAEKDALNKHQIQRKSKSEKWKRICSEIPLPNV